MRTLLAALLITACSAAAAAAQGTEGHISVSATVIPAAGSVALGGDVRIEASRRGASLTAGLRATGGALATVSVEGPGAAACRLERAPASAGSTVDGEVTELFRDAGRLTCTLTRGGRGSQALPVTLVMVPPTD
jgi:hypothetical protein